MEKADSLTDSEVGLRPGEKKLYEESIATLYS